ncbi:MAG: hypothetical protein ABIB71_07525, partial [Candidatus Woesearchaeota archaeon]
SEYFHSHTLFPTLDIALAHGDDPYSMYNRRGKQEIPIAELFYAIDELEEQFLNPVIEYPEGYEPEDERIPNADQAWYNHHKRMKGLAYDNMAFPLLLTRCRELDIGGRYNLRDSLTGNDYKPLFTDVDSMIQAVDAEIRRVGAEQRVKAGLLSKTSRLPLRGSKLAVSDWDRACEYIEDNSVFPPVLYP